MSVTQRVRTVGAAENAGAGTGAGATAAPRPVFVDGTELRLREFAPRDVDGVLAIFGDPLTTRQFGMRPFTRRDAAALVEQAVTAARQRPRTLYRLAVSSIRTGELLGSVKLIVEESPEGEIVTTGYRSAEVGCALRSDLTNKGLSLEVGHLLAVLGFERLGLHRIWTGFLPSNVAAQRAADKSGMTREGVLRDYCHADGVWHDLVLYSILETDWQPAPAQPATVVPLARSVAPTRS
ncbi:GNAT family N-acetyltransferase [Streptomyces phytohabitans]|uniref:GNAT family N-acetyltransferase n=1 Tax=Streptomyces phytohabitans TaxID=1150371 RepID=UPI00345C025C